MNILFVSNSFPTNIETKVHGIFKRMNLFIDAIKSFATIHFLFYVSPTFDVSEENVSNLEKALSDYWQAEVSLTLFHRSKRRYKFLNRENFLPGTISFFNQPSYLATSDYRQVRAFEQALSKKPDAIFVHRLQSICPVLLTAKELPPVFFDLDDIEHISLTRQIEESAQYRKKSKASRLYIHSLKRGEISAIRKASMTFVCSKHDKHYLSNRLKLPNVVTIPNAVSLPSEQSTQSEPILLFIGSYTYRPNISAAEFLIEEIWPYILEEVPNAQLKIAGSSPERIRSYNHSIRGVKFTGFVKDINNLYSSTRVVCCSILSGGGTRLKLIEAAAYKKPIVSTKIGAEGLEFTDGKSIILQDNPQAFAQACIQLLKNDDLCEQLGNAAFKIASEHYDRIKIIQQIQDQIQI